MSSRSRIKVVHRVVAASLVAATLAGCSDIYYDRRETIAYGADDAVASNKAIHIIDPWPRHSANRNLVFNGERMQAAVECYRKGRVITPSSAMTSSTYTKSSGDQVTSCPEKVAAPPAPAVVNNISAGGK